MFDLTREIERWVASVTPPGCRTDTNAEELVDHLHCEVGSLCQQGLSPQQAFLVATEAMGAIEQLRREYRKNQGWMTVLCGRNPSPRGTIMTKQQARRFRLVWIVLLLIVTVVISISMAGHNNTAGLLGLIYIVWITPLYLIPGLMVSPRQEWICLRKRIGRLLASGG